MKLKEPVTIMPPPYSDNNGSVIYPNPITFEDLKITVHDNFHTKTIGVHIQGIPTIVSLVSKEEYDDFGEWSRQNIFDKLLQKMGDHPAAYLRSIFPKTLEENPNHPGTVLAKMIKSLGIKMTDSCACRRHALEMNEKGNDWCEQNIDTIVGWLREEAKARGLPFIDMAGRLAVSRAIKKSRKLLANQPVPENDEDLDNI